MKKKIILMTISMILIMTSSCSKNEGNGVVIESNNTQNVVANNESSTTAETQKAIVEENDNLDIIVLKGLQVNSYTEVPVKDGNYINGKFNRSKFQVGLKIYFDDYYIARIDTTEVIENDFITDLDWLIRGYFRDDKGFGDVWDFTENPVTKDNVEYLNINGYDMEKSEGILHFTDTDKEPFDVYYYGYVINFNGESVIYLVYDTEKENVEKGKSTLDQMVNTFRAWESTDVEYED